MCALPDCLTAARQDWEDLEEAKPFLSAFLQSSLPDDIFADIRHFAHSHGFSRKVSSDNASDPLSGDTTVELATGSASGLGSRQLDRKESLRLRAASPHSHLSDGEEEQELDCDDSEEAGLLGAPDTVAVDNQAPTSRCEAQSADSSSNNSSRSAKRSLTAAAASASSSPEKMAAADCSD